MNGLQLVGWLALCVYVARAVYVDWRATCRPKRLPDELTYPLDVSLGDVPHSDCQQQGRYEVRRLDRF